MNRAIVSLVALLVLLAGCSSLTGGPAGTPTPTPTDTPTATPTPTPGGAEELAPGVTSERIENPVALIDAHQRGLLADGFVVNQTLTSTYNGTVSNRLNLTLTAGPGGEVAYMNGSSSGFDFEGDESVIVNSVWVNTTHQYNRHIESGSTTYDLQKRLYPAEYFVWFGSLQRDIQLAGTDHEVTSVESGDGLDYITLTATIDRVGNDGVTDTVSTLVVDENGIIRSADVRVDYGEGQTYHTTYEVVQLGAAAPERPAWVDTVPPSASLQLELDVFGFNESSIELVHLYGDAVPEGAIVTVISNGTLYETTLEEPFGDDRRYLWVATDGTLRATAELPATDATQALGREVTVEVHAPDGGELFTTSIGRR
jgi:hypothetical protein